MGIATLYLYMQHMNAKKPFSADTIVTRGSRDSAVGIATDYRLDD
jgi:hypothetical protein